MKKWVSLILLLAASSLLFLVLDAEGQQAQKTKPSRESPAASSAEPAYPTMPGPGKKIFIGDDHYFIYSFDKTPKMGIVIIKVELYGRDGKRDTSLEAKADAGMPSMKGAHETGDRPFKISKKGDYLLPIDIVMPGDWEIRLSFVKQGKVIFRGSYQFDV